MTEKDEQFIDDCKYFWKYKWNIEQYVSYDPMRLAKLDNNLLKLWLDYKAIKNDLDEYCNL